MPKKKKEKIGKINPNEIKSRDILHMQEFLNGTGGFHQEDKKAPRRKNRKEEKDYEDE